MPAAKAFALVYLCHLAEVGREGFGDRFAGLRDCDARCIRKPGSRDQGAGVHASGIGHGRPVVVGLPVRIPVVLPELGALDPLPRFGPLPYLWRGNAERTQDSRTPIQPRQP
ncbi:hypothetical protein GCM10010193_32480 [Kitasatospora atroaurantiaca]